MAAELLSVFYDLIGKSRLISLKHISQLKHQNHLSQHQKCCERSVTRKLNLNFIRVIKICVSIEILYVSGSNLSKMSFLSISCSISCLERLLVGSTALSCKTWKYELFQFCQC